jgi:hypothetical protein
MKKLILIVFIVSCFSHLFSQKIDEPVKEFKNEFGINLGATTGVGLSYRHWFGDFGFQLTALPIKTDDYAMVSTGFTLLYSFHSARYFRFYGYLGNHYMYTKRKESYFSLNSEPDVFVEKRRYNMGIGPGFALGKVVRMNLQFGYGFYDILDDQNLLPAGEIGLYYNF